MSLLKNFQNGNDLNKTGYLKGKLLNPNDLELFRNILSTHVSSILKENISFMQLTQINDIKLEEITKNKTLRIFSKKNSQILLNTVSIKNLLNSRPNLTICNAIDPLKGLTNLPEVYFRIVQPNTGGNPELGHIDWWYDDIYNINYNIRPTFKIWISLQTEPNKNGLLIRKSSLLDNFEYYIKNTDFGPRPKLLNPIAKSEYDFPAIASGEAIIFDSKKTLHMGAENTGKKCRISIEISIRQNNG